MNSHRDAEDGAHDPRKLIALLGTTGDELARTLGLDNDATRRLESDDIQRRIGSMIEVLSKVEPRFGSMIMAYAWYRSEPLSGFSGQTAMELVRCDRVQDVLTYLDAVHAGVHV
jgi:hypothetical protein